MTVRPKQIVGRLGRSQSVCRLSLPPSREVSIAFLLLAALLDGFCAGTASAQQHHRDLLYQVSTIDALLAGVYDGVATVGEVLERGGFGIGTFEGLDGELIALDGVVYQAASNGSVNRMPPDTRTPFMAVTHFLADQQLTMTGPLDIAGFQAQIQARLPSRNLFYAIHADAGFAHIRYRSVARQDKPYAPLVELVREQAIFEQRDVAGTLIGFWCPAFAKGLNVPGFHLHFLSADRKHGGHVLGFTLEQAEVRVDHTDAWEIALPATPAYLKADLQGDRSAELHAVEQARPAKAD
jgi:acetolactate decarboxylase